ncbi:salicylate hydroxylase [Actinomadura pelletieri DSM 43383]|uniref:Salicylate hydroxylase n=1 Tax=Actinomadura pelletieri DSM 43383 TaxID=1120940 RepID=A0A495QKK4_9ACTN|nr:FAD-dependent monooxygenase [Actinomadura pelletieri]RKS73117.1 salicylate hydroxylase [Actinomadura pelletieri DSM 43383]
MAQLTVAVAGAGIAGLTLAAALDRHGIDCHVYEQAERLAEVGAGVQVAPNATRLLRRLGLGDRLSAVAVAPEAIEARRWDDGALLRRTPLGDLCRRRFGAPYYTLHRADLHDALLSLVPPDRVHLGARCVAVTRDAGAARLRLADGTAITADLVVGADGIHSVVREHLVTDRPHYSGHTIYRGLVPAEKVPHLLDEPRVRLWFGPEQHCVCYPVSSGRQVSFGATVPAPDWREESWSARGDVADLAAAYRGWHADVAELVGAAETVGRWALHDREGIDRLAAGRIAVIGDAAHPMLPFQAQGANQAVEDAVVLAVCLSGVNPADGPDALSAALRRYEEIRLPRTTRIQRRSRDSVKTFHRTHDDAQNHDTAARNPSVLEDYRWLFEYDAEQAAMTSGS